MSRSVLSASSDDPHTLVSVLDVLKSYAGIFAGLSGTLADLEAHYKRRCIKSGNDTRVGKRDLKWKPFLEHMLRDCAALDLLSTIDQIDRMRRIGPTATVVDVQAEFKDLRNRLTDELSRRFFVAVATNDVDFFQVPPPFSVRVQVTFRHAYDDMVEAGKCLAFDRNTAAVFHIHNYVEATLALIGRRLKITRQPRMTWGLYLKGINEKAVALAQSKKSDARSTKQLDFLREAIMVLTAMNRCYRGPTAHGMRTHTPEEARALFRFSITWMELVAARYPRRLPKRSRA